jgi:hypothetical protein
MFLSQLSREAAILVDRAVADQRVDEGGATAGEGDAVARPTRKLVLFGAEREYDRPRQAVPVGDASFAGWRNCPQYRPDALH